MINVKPVLFYVKHATRLLLIALHAMMEDFYFRANV